MKILTTFYSKVNGTTFANSQELIKTLQPEEPLELIPEPTNKFDKNAIKIVYKGQKLGYLPRDTAESFGKQVPEGAKFMAEVSEITGAGKSNAGCNIKVVIYQDEEN